MQLANSLKKLLIENNLMREEEATPEHVTAYLKEQVARIIENKSEGREFPLWLNKGETAIVVKIPWQPAPKIEEIEVEEEENELRNTQT